MKYCYTYIIKYAITSHPRNGPNPTLFYTENSAYKVTETIT